MKQLTFYIHKDTASSKKSEKSDESLWKYEQKTLILVHFGQKWPNLDHFGPKRGPILIFLPRNETINFLQT